MFYPWQLLSNYNAELQYNDDGYVIISAEVSMIE